jgi:hypothetical protein
VGAKYGFAAMAVSSLITGTFGHAYGAPLSSLHRRTSWLVGAICGAISVWLFFRT